jgi:hypothetical protein
MQRVASQVADAHQYERLARSGAQASRVRKEHVSQGALKFGDHEGEHEHVQEDAEEALGHRQSIAPVRDRSDRPE